MHASCITYTVCIYLYIVFSTTSESVLTYIILHESYSIVKRTYLRTNNNLLASRPHQLLFVSELTD